MKEIQRLVVDILDEINIAKRVEDLTQILSDLKGNELVPNKNFLKEEKYPNITFAITKDDVNKIKNLGKSFSEIIKKGKSLSPLEKLTLSILWKQGDLGKEKHIIDGIVEDSLVTERSSGLVFYQFGKRLKDPSKHPIIDQHIMRTFMWYNKPSDLSILKINEIGKKHNKSIEHYIQWINDIAERCDGDKEKILFTVDKILFALGKTIKRK